jgi:hypothetical protein
LNGDFENTGTSTLGANAVNTASQLPNWTQLNINGIIVPSSEVWSGSGGFGAPSAAGNNHLEADFGVYQDFTVPANVQSNIGRLQFQAWNRGNLTLNYNVRLIDLSTNTALTLNPNNNGVYNMNGTSWTTNVYTATITPGQSYRLFFDDNTNSQSGPHLDNVSFVVVSPLEMTGNTAFCQGESTTLNFPAATASATWISPAGITNSGTAPLAPVVIDEAGTWIFTLVDSLGCTYTDTVDITSIFCCVNPTVTVTSSAGTSICSGANTDLSVASNAIGATYLWSDGSTTSSINIQNATTVNSGIYGVTVTDANGCTASDDLVLFVNSQIGLGSTLSNTTCAGNDGQVNIAISGGIPSYNLSLNGPSSQSLTGVISNEIFDQLSPGSYTLTVTDDIGCTATQTFSILNGCACQPLNIVLCGPLVDCEKGSLVITPNYMPQIPAGATYAWTTTATAAITGSTSVSTLNISSLSLGHSGDYTVVVSYGNGCTATATVPVIVNPRPVISGITQSGPVFTGCNITLSAPTGFNFYSWTRGTNQLGNGENITVSTSSPSLFASSSSSSTVSLLVADANGCTATANTTTRRMDDPVVGIIPCADFTLTSQRIRLSVTNLSGFTYNWSGPNGPIAATTSTVNITQAPALLVGTYTVTVTAPNDPTCFRVVTFTVNPCGSSNRDASPDALIESMEPKSMLQLDVFPNPTSDRVNWEVTALASDAKLQHISIVDSKGQVVDTKNLAMEDAQKGTFDLSSLPAGMYYILMVVNEETYQYEIVRH